MTTGTWVHMSTMVVFNVMTLGRCSQCLSDSGKIDKGSRYILRKMDDNLFRYRDRLEPYFDSSGELPLLRPSLPKFDHLHQGATSRTRCKPPEPGV